MPTETRKLVIRTHRPWLRGFIWGTSLLLAASAIYLAFEIGRRGAGHDSLGAWQQRRELHAKIEQLDQENARLRARLADLETGQVSGRQERVELTRSVGELQQQIARQNRDLAFYRGIVSSTAGGTSVRIHRITIVPGEAADQFDLRLVLVQTTRAERTVSGTMTLTLEGLQQDQPTTYPLERLAVQKRDPLKFSFRYFEDIDQSIVLPPGFRPAKVHVEVRVADRTGEPLTETFEWRVQDT